MKTFLFCCLLVTQSFAVAQTFPFDLWHQGKVVLQGGDTIKGLVKYDRENFLQIKYDNKIEIHSSSTVLSFEIFDQSYKRSRKFYSLPYANQGGYKTPFFFEFVSDGKITILSRESVVARTMSASHIAYPPKIKLQLVDKYFILKENGDVESFIGKKKDWYGLMSSRRDKIQDYVKQYKLDFDKKYDLKQIIDYYNSFFNQQ